MLNKLKSFIQACIRPFMYVLYPMIAEDSLYRLRCFGNRNRLTIAPTAMVNNAFFNTISGDIQIADYVFFGQNVAVYTGTHDITKFDRERQMAVPSVGRDVKIRRGAWIASSSIIVGPCTIGEHAVVAAGSVVVNDVPPYALVAGVPARVIRDVRDTHRPAEPAAAAPVEMNAL